MQDATIDIKLPRRSLLVQFTCDLCGERTNRLVNRLAYERGLIYVQVVVYLVIVIMWNLCCLFLKDDKPVNMLILLPCLLLFFSLYYFDSLCKMRVIHKVRSQILRRTCCFEIVYDLVTLKGA